MAKLDDLIQQKQQRDEDWKAKKTAEREELGQLSDDAVMRVTSEPGAYLHYLDTQAINPRYSASNVMLAMAQNPDITYINSLEVWNRLGRSVNRDENGMKIRVSDTYVKDGREYHGYKIGRVFDVTQTHGKAGVPALSLKDNTPEMDAALRRLLDSSPVPVVTSSTMYQDAVYDPIWQTIVTINGGMQAIGYGLLVLFFAIGIFRSASGFRDFQRPEHLLRHFIYFVLAKLGITYGMDLLVDVFDVCNGIVATAAGSIGGLTGASVALPQEIADAIGDVGFLASIPLWLVTLLGSLFITVLAFIMILTVYGRFFKIYMYAALSPVALASFAGEGTSNFGKAFLRSYVGVCMEGAVIVLACIIFSAFSSSGTPVVDSSVSVVTQVWSYLGEVIFNLLVLVGLVKSADHIAKEMLGL